MRRGFRFLAALAALATVAGCASGGSDTLDTGAGYQAGDGSYSSWQGDERAGPIEVEGVTYDGEELFLPDWQGDVVVLNFWYAACPPCRAEADDLGEISEEYAADGVKFLGINPRDDAGAAQAFERTFEVPYPSLHDAQARAVAAMEGIVPLQAMPTTVVIDREGTVAARILGQIDPAVLRGLIDDTLAEA